MEEAFGQDQCAVCLTGDIIQIVSAKLLRKTINPTQLNPRHNSTTTALFTLPLTLVAQSSPLFSIRVLLFISYILNILIEKIATHEEM